MKSQSHTLFTYETEGDLVRASCLYCPWVSEWFDTKGEAKRAHADHNLSQRINLSK